MCVSFIFLDFENKTNFFKYNEDHPQIQRRAPTFLCIRVWSGRQGSYNMETKTLEIKQIPFMQITMIVHEHRGARPPFYALDSGAGDREINI